MQEQATGEFLTSYIGLSLVFQGKSSISARWFELEDNDRAIGVFALNTIPIVPLNIAGADLGDVSLWPPPPSPPPRYPRCLAPDAADPEPVAPIEDIAAGAQDVSDDVVDPEDEDGTAEEWLAELEDMLDTMMGEGEATETIFEPPSADAQEGGPPAAGSAPPSRAAEEGPEFAAPPEPESAIVEAEGQGMVANRALLQGRRGTAEVTVIVPGGYVSFYSNKMVFQATCDNPNHGTCKLTRTCRGGSAGSSGAPNGGRPVAFLAAWLANGEHLESKPQHWDRAVMNSSLEQRVRLRNMFKQVESGRRLLSYERPAAPNEPEEPVDLAPYLR